MNAFEPESARELISDSEFSLSLAQLPQLREKALVDMINGVAVGREHVRVQRLRTGMLSRFADSLTGEGSRRQIEINENLAAGVEGAVAWLKELEAEHVKSNVQIVRMNWCLEKLAQRLGKTREVIVGMDHELQALKSRVEDLSADMSRRLRALEGRVDRLEWMWDAELHLRGVLSDWHDGRFDAEPLLTQAYLVADSLYWGAFGAACLRCRDLNAANDRFVELSKSLRPGFRKELSSRLDLSDSAADTGKPFLLDRWRIRNASGRNTVHPEVLSYLGDWANEEEQPLSTTATRPDESPPLHMPRLLSVGHACTLLQNEVLGDSRL